MKKRMPEADLDNIMPMLIRIWRRFMKISGPVEELQTREFRSVVELVLALQGKRDKQEMHDNYFADRAQLGAYVLYDWVLHYMQGLSLINEIPRIPTRVLDVCSGPGAFSFAALRHGATDVTAIDRSETALQLAGEICGRYGYTLTARQWHAEKGLANIEGKFDLIIVGHALDELFPSTRKGWVQEQQRFIDSLLDKLEEDGYLLLVESSQTPDNQRLLSIRDRLVQEGVPVQAPCVWRGECPALKSNTPCYAQREFERPYLVREIQRSARIRQSSLKMSYVFFRSRKAVWPAVNDRPLYRVISPAMEGIDSERFYLCGVDGKKMLESKVSDDRVFVHLKRGELISVDHPQRDGNRLIVTDETDLTIAAALNKPVPE